MTPASEAIADWKRSDAIHHDREARRYDDLIGREFEPYQSLHTAMPWAKLLESAGARTVLDIGGGTGRTAIPVAARGAAVVMIDTSRGMLQQARAKARHQRGGRIDLVVADAELLPFAGGSFDAVVCQGVLHHLPDVSAAVDEADRVLGLGGWLCLAEPDRSGSWLSRLVLRFAGVMRPLTGWFVGRRSPAATHERPLAGRELADRLVHAGYTVSTAYLVHPPIVYRFLPGALSLLLAGALNRGAGSRRSGDIIVLKARKPDAAVLVGPSALG